MALPDLAHIRALALLGEPGIGKSTTLKAEAERIAAVADPNNLSIYINLRAYASEAVLLQKIFETPIYTAWKNGTAHLFLHLDSLDEALLRVETIANLLAEELSQQPIERMSVRIACRTAVWPLNTLGRALTEIWGPDAATVFELAPLRRRDVLQAATAHQINPDAFLEAVFGTNAVPFAIKPLTLNMLLGIFQRDGSLPTSSIELYTKGCLKLCEEQNPSRLDTHRQGRLNFAQRLRVAGRIAAATMLANRYAVWTGPEADGVPAEYIPSSTLIGTREEGALVAFDVTADDVREVLDTGLFNSRGDGLMGWAHQSYAEFLAAKYLVDRNVTAGTVLKILLHPEGGLVPQLSTVAAWVSSLNPEVRAALLTSEPMALLSADITNWSAGELSALTTSLLSSYQQKRITDAVFGISLLYARLKHSGIAPILKPYITDKTMHLVARRAAITIAEMCVVHELQPALLAIALDTSDDYAVRARAVSALRPIGDHTVPPLMLPLARGEAGMDPTDDIKGQALDILWPNHISPVQLFELLSPPNEGYFGAYSLFLSELPKNLRTEDLTPALQWATALIRRITPYDNAFHIKTLADAILFRAWKEFENPLLTELFLQHVTARLHQHGDLCRGTDHRARDAFLRELVEDAARRRLFLRELAKTEVQRVDAFCYFRAGLLTRDDVVWLISVSPGGDQADVSLNAQTLINLIDIALDQNSIGHIEALFAATNRWPLLRHQYAFAIDGIPLDSAEVARHRETQRQLRELEEDRPPPLEANPDQRVRSRLERFEAGHMEAWWQLNIDLTLTPTTHAVHVDFEYTITKMPGWIAADEGLRRRLLAAAERYLVNAESTVDQWLGTNQLYYPDMAAYRAFILLHNEEPAAYARLPQFVWTRWTPAIAGLPKDTGSENSEGEVAVYKDALAKAPEAFSAAVRTIIKAERERHASGDETTVTPVGLAFLIVRELPEEWERTPLVDGVFEELKSPDNTPDQFAALLEPLLRAGHAPAQELAVNTISGELSLPYKLIAAEKLARHCAGRVWPALWEFITADDERARTLLLSIAHHYHFDMPFYAGVAEDSVAALYILLERLFPRMQDPVHQGGHAHYVGPQESMVHIRDSVPRYLVALGTRDAVNALRRCVAALPALDWLPFELSRAEQVMRIKTWAPLELNELFAVTDRADARLVSTPEDLRDLLLATLRRYELYLHGPQTPVRGLWDYQAASRLFRPVDENALSDAVKLYLEQELQSRGIVANREVEISHAPGAPVGQRTDIRIDAIRKSADGAFYEVITAVIESKGCWNDGLFSDLKEQLHGTYMVRLQAPVGIYLVGWFDKPKWDPADYRRGRVPNAPLAEVQSRLSGVAEAISIGYLVSAVVLDCHAM